ncbi:hypothetical protein PybrP1_012151 [[Pythium] brassicae (nom. inval.)]|nr:hypothetical protein PybrP1_012151 [[Pythium] brassicae (nom. inval.)]
MSQAKAFVMSSRRDAPQQRSGDASLSTPTDVDTDAFKQAMWEGQANILVTVRLRPRLGHEHEHDEIVKVLDHRLVVVLDSTAAASEPSGLHSPTRRHTSHPVRKLRQAAVSSAPQRRSREKRFAFDYVFSPEDNQQAVYCQTTKFLIHGPGIMALTLEDLFQTITRVHADPLASVTYKVTVSFLEVYNENIRDLLAHPSPSSSLSSSEFLDLREDPVKGAVIAGISEIEACNAQEVMKLLRKGNKNRSQEATAANAVSSRSHAVLQVLVEQREKTSAPSSSGMGLDGAGEAAGDEPAVTSVVNVDHHITEYVGVISGLRNEVAALKKQLVRQQQAASADPTALRRRSRHASNNNDSEDDEDDDSGASALEAGGPSAQAIQARLQEVRQHIARYFNERLRLRETLLRIDFQIGGAKDALLKATGGAEEKSADILVTSPEIDSVTLEKNQEDNAGPASTTSPETSSSEKPPQAVESPARVRNQEALKELVEYQRSLVQELARLEARMEDFRAAILESATLREHELFGEVLMMEYRVGNLEVDKMELQVAKELRDIEVDALLKLQRSVGEGTTGETPQRTEDTTFKLPVLLNPLSPKLSTTQLPNCTSSVGDNSALSQRDSPRRGAALGFMDDLRDRFQTLKSSRDVDDPKQRQPRQEQRHSQTLSSGYASATSSSARKQWGLSLASTTLPYIRLKKKPSVDELSSLTPDGTLETSMGAAAAATTVSASSSATGPYLRVLKHRRKSQHQSANKSSKRA